ncbi:MAG: leucyl/phenylalanyl-tRNA--protein transferase [Flavobacteriaceae bacterium]|nr:leucyl/phenylalanyl-tRNA--protein transferase [Flavobacteriaceae bacterium]
MFILDKTLHFPSVHLANAEGVVAYGGDLSPDRLILAYKSGIFPWYSEGYPITWYSPEPRMVLFPKDIKISKSMRQFIKKNPFEIRFNSAFAEVIRNCKTAKRNGEAGTWITNAMEEAYNQLHKQGWAKSVEVYQNSVLVGGLYGIDLGTVFCGESMFSKVSNASKVAFIWLVNYLADKDYKLIDCQVYNQHLDSLGAVEIPRTEFLSYL